MKINQKGFSIVEILIIIVVIGVIGGAGWYAWQSKKSDTKTSDTSSNSQTETTPEESAEPEQTKKELETFTTDTGVRFSYPKEHELAHYSWDHYQNVEKYPASRGYLETTQIIVKSKEYPNVFACVDFSSDANNDKGLPRTNPVKVSDFSPLNDKQLELYSHTNGDQYQLSLGKNQASVTDNKGYPVAMWVSLNCMQGADKYLSNVKKPLAELDAISEAKEILTTVSVQ